ncbi:hypothetical protein AWM70_12070 [Paenibacillus yonginensis]|uniref:Uncharacterized protein n=1 Tax=Paenibacillus yonginensis TaxID=1462996 RepID=A0A1B1N1G4_9BACL|nr:hypothetical protein [Paenibacillus yonginensis]ANS75246.1 hypothetical protein AWM70_12070 [Paenibacillus yonginensis]
MKFTATSRILQQLDSLTMVGERSYISVILTNGTVFTNYSADEYNQGKSRPGRERQSGIGLLNVAERLRIRFGELFRMNIESRPAEGITIQMSISIRRERLSGEEDSPDTPSNLNSNKAV